MSCDGSDQGVCKSNSNISKQSKKIKKVPKMSEEKMSKKTEKTKKTNEHLRGTNQNIIKNYIRAIISFITSPLSETYLNPLLKQYAVGEHDFLNFVCTYKDRIESIRSLIELIKDHEDDDNDEYRCKNIFREICIIFLRYFAQNWIYGSIKLKHKEILMKNRLRLKNIIRNPANKVMLVRPHEE